MQCVTQDVNGAVFKIAHFTVKPDFVLCTHIVCFRIAFSRLRYAVSNHAVASSSKICSVFDAYHSIADEKEKLMDWKLFATVFGAIFIAEMADKTQLVTLLFAADKDAGKWTVFLGSALALTLASAIGVAAGALLSQVINARMMSMIAGAGFIVIGVFTLYHGWHGAA
jgi:putative Ca2+/H+ antiporter (TMEM165/GDT1 family)